MREQVDQSRGLSTSLITLNIRTLAACWLVSVLFWWIALA